MEMMSMAPSDGYSERKGICVAGNIVADVVKNIDAYPGVGMLANIKSVSLAVGGSVPNVGIDLRTLDPDLPVAGLGLVGDDEYGKFILSRLVKSGMDVSGIRVSPSALTSFSDVMSLPGGERTFFHARGANAEFGPEHIDIDRLGCRILHIGYILLLDRFDASDPEYGTVMARFLKDVRARGILTSVDLVSDTSGRFAQTVLPALKYCDYFIANEFECCRVWGAEPRTAAGALDIACVKNAMERTLSAGAMKKVIVHAPEAGLCLSREGGFTLCPSLDIPEDMIKGSVGAGDAFCAGALTGIYRGMDDMGMLEFASAAAGCSLMSVSAVGGMMDFEAVYRFMRAFPRKKLPNAI